MTGISRVPMMVAASIPPNTAVPRATREPAPVATTSGTMPSRKESAVIITAQKAQPGGLDGGVVDGETLGLALFLGEFHDQDGVLGRQPDEHDQPDLGVEIHIQPGGADGG